MFQAQPGFPEGLVFSAIGFAIGMISGAFGVGGGFAWFPLLQETLGFSAAAAAATSTSQIPVNGLSGLYRHFRLGNVRARFPLLLLWGALPGALSASFLISAISDQVADAKARYSVALSLLYMVVVSATGIFTILKSRPKKEQQSGQMAGPEPASVPGGPSFARLALAILLAFLFSHISVLIGIGGGTFFVPLFIFLLGLRPVEAIAGALFLMVLFSLSATVQYGIQPNSPVDWSVVGFILLGTVPGAQVGARWISGFDGNKIKWLFGAFQILLAVGYGLYRLLSASP